MMLQTFNDYLAAHPTADRIVTLFGTLFSGLASLMPLVLVAGVCAAIPRRASNSLRGLFAIGGSLLLIFVTSMWPAAEAVQEAVAPSASSLLSWLIWLPFVGAAIVALLPRQSTLLARGVTMGVMLVTFTLSLRLLSTSMGRGFHFEENIDWFPSLGIHYHLVVDGLSLWLVLLTTFIVPLATYASFGSIHTRIKDWCFALLLLQGALIGTFVAVDLVLFYVFFELGLVPMYIMVGVWGGTNRIKSALKLFIYTMTGSVMMLAAILYLGHAYEQLAGKPSFDFFELQRLHLPMHTQVVLWAAFSLAFFIKVPMLPVHTWLPDAHTEAPTAGSVILAAVMLKMGTYGYLRFCMGLFPEASLDWAPTLGGLAVLGIIYGAFCAWRQTDIKKLIAYSSIAHLGFVMFGLFAATPASIDGAVLQMVSHGISTGALFLLVGVVYDRRHTREMSEYGGIAKSMPLYTALFVVATMSSVGVPGLNGFVGEFMIINGSAVSAKLGRAGALQAMFAATGVILAALYMLTLVQRVFFGPLKSKANAALRDINSRELIAIAPLVALMFIVGLFPKLMLDSMHDASLRVVDQLEAAATGPRGKAYEGPAELRARATDSPPLEAVVAAALEPVEGSAAAAAPKDTIHAAVGH